MATSDSFTEQPISPLTGLLDVRSMPGEMPFAVWRWRQNFATPESGTLCRRYGWRKFLFEQSPYQNHDLHDQLLAQQTYYDDLEPVADGADEVQTYPPSSDLCGTTIHTRGNGREPITLLFESTSTDGARRLIAGTQSRLYTLRPTPGNWKLIADGKGGTTQSGLPERRWQAAEVNDVVVFTNDYDPILYWNFDQPTQGCEMQSVATIPSLETIRLTRAATVYSWKGILFLGDVEMELQRVRHRVVWSNLNAPLEFDPADGGITGYQDLDYGERILRFRELGDNLVIYTTRAIWIVTYVGGDQVFQFQRRYMTENGDSCLQFPNTLSSVSDYHIYSGKDGIYVFNLFLTAPERVSWIHAATGFLYQTLAASVCEGHVATYFPELDEYWISWVETGQQFPRWTLVVNLGAETKAADYVDAGFTAFLSHTPDLRPDIDSFVLDNCICSHDELAALDADGTLQAPQKEGEPCVAATEEACEDVDTSTTAYTSETIEAAGKTIEDPFDETPDGELCALLNSIDFDALCRECSAASRPIMVSAVDWCIKEYTAVGYRERCTVFTACGTYVQDGYTSILRSGPMRGKSDRDLLRMSRMEIHFDAEAQTIPSDIGLRVGWSSLPLDANNPRCALKWKVLTPKPLSCPTETTADQHDSEKTTPFQTVGWNFLIEGRSLYFEFSIAGTGGLSCFSTSIPFIAGSLLQRNA